ncbi:MAG: alginate lyase family protein, partial [Armatimonadota bacterium]
GASADAEHVTQGAGSIRWRLAEPKGIGTAAIPHDWSAFNALCFDLYAENAVGSPLWLILPSEDPAQEGPDYFSLRLRLDFEGWKHFILPFDEIGRVRQPVGWHQIEAFRLHSAWDPNIEVNPEAVVYVDNVRLEQFSDTGPRMTDPEFFAALDLERPELAAVQQAVAAGDLEAAKSAWAAHLRQRRMPRWFEMWYDRPEPVPPERANLGAAERALAHIFSFQSQQFELGADIDWSSNQMTEGESATVEWNASLNRHGLFSTLASAWWRTGDRKWTDELVAMWLDWIEDAPVLLNSSGNSPYHWAWETLNTAVRASNAWPNSLFRTLDSPSWTDEAIVTVTKSFAEHARHLLAWPSHGNWLTAESTGLYYAGVLFPEFREAANWRQVGLQRLYAQMEEEVYPDGLEYELALGYGLWVLRNYSDVLDFALLNEQRDELPADWLERIEAMYDYVLYASMPNGTVPGLNDSGNADRLPYMERAARYFPDRADFAWAASGGAQGEMPTDTSRAFDYSGHYVMRTGWGPEDRFLLLDAGPFGSGHQHEDKLTLILYALGRMHLVDAGNYMYDKSRWRRYVLSTRGHNTVRVDGLDQHRRGLRETYVLPFPFQPIGNPWVSGEDFDFAQGSYTDGYGDDNAVRVTHTRSVLFVKPDYWLVVDRLTPEDDAVHQYEALFHLDADEAAVDDDLVVTSLTGDDQSHLVIAPLPTEGLSVEVVKGVEEEPVQGWSWAMIGRSGAIPTAIYRLSGAGVQTMAYVLWPVEANGAPPLATLERLDAPEGTLAGVLALADGSRHAFVFQPRAAEAAFGGSTTDAEVAFVEVRGDGTIGRSFLYGGNELRPAH